MKTLAIIGGGAAGMMCAATLLEHSGTPMGTEGLKIHLFEKNAVLGKKVSISGGGRCNVTTGITDRKILLGKYPRGAEFLKRSLGKFWPGKVREWFESHGVAMKCEADLRVFPVSDSGADVIGAFESVFARNRETVTIHRSTDIKSVRHRNGNYLLSYSESGKESEMAADFVVVTTGGNAYAHTGSSGDGYGFARMLGHTVTPLGPSLSSFETVENFPKEISGISLPKARLKWNADMIAEGPLLFTHFGISGPAPFAFSSLLAFETIDPGHPLAISLAPLAGWQMPDWDAHIEKEAKTHGGRETRNLLDVLPRRLVDALGTEGILPNRILGQKGAVLSREDRKTLAKVLGEGISLTIKARRAGDEFVTAWGVSCEEIDPETLESKLSPWLYFAGEVLNVDGFTGGFNLQAAWCTGRAVGKSLAWRLDTGRKTEV